MAERPLMFVQFALIERDANETHTPALFSISTEILCGGAETLYEPYIDRLNEPPLSSVEFDMFMVALNAEVNSYIDQLTPSLMFVLAQPPEEVDEFSQVLTRVILNATARFEINRSSMSKKVHFI